MRSNPGDLASANRYRTALLRLARTSPEEASPRLADLEGALCAPTSFGIEQDRGSQGSKRELPRLQRVSTSGGRPLLQPRCPGGDPRELWRVGGIACWLSDGIVLLEAPDRSLEARDPSTGDLLWSVPSVCPSRWSLDEDERAEALPWAVAPWGAVEVCACYQAPLLYERVSRDRPREVAGRGVAAIELTVQLLLAEGGSWPGSRTPPEIVIERAEPGQALCDTDVCLEAWDDALIELSLDPGSRTFGLRWRDDDQDWSILRVGGGGDVPGHLGPAGWTSEDEEPFPAPPEPLSEPPPLLEVAGEAAPVRAIAAAGLLFAQVGDETLVAFGGAS